MTDYSKQTTTDLFEILIEALHGTSLGAAVAIADEMCSPARMGTCPDLVTSLDACPLFTCGYSAEQLQGLRDRIEQYNSYVEQAWREHYSRTLG